MGKKRDLELSNRQLGILEHLSNLAKSIYDPIHCTSRIPFSELIRIFIRKYFEIERDNEINIIEKTLTQNISKKNRADTPVIYYVIVNFRQIVISK